MNYYKIYNTMCDLKIKNYIFSLLKLRSIIAILFSLQCLVLTAQVIEFSDDTKFVNLLSYDSKTSEYYNKKYTSSLCVEELKLFAEFDLYNIDSSLDFINSHFSGLASGVGAGYRNFSFKVKGHRSSAPEISSTLGKIFLYNKNLDEQGVAAIFNYTSADFPFYVEPFFSFNSFSFTEGDLYSFKGNLVFPDNSCIGVKVGFNNQNIRGILGSLSGHIMNNNVEEVLFNVNSYYWLADFEGFINFNNWKFNYDLGYFGCNLGSGGSLTKSNQRYFVFPYEYLQLVIEGRLDSLITKISVDYSSKYSVFELGLENYYCICALLNVNMEYKYKKNKLLKLDGSLGTQNVSSDIISECGLLIPYVNFSAKVDREKTKACVFACKRFYIPIISEKLKGENSDDQISDKVKITLKEYLLSGLSIGAKIKL